MLLLARDHLETDRLVLRQLHDSDVERMVLLANHIEIARNLATMPHPYGRDDAKAFLGKVENPKFGCAFAIVEKATGDLIGVAGWGPMEDGDLIDFGYWLGLDYWGKGFATEAGAAVLTHAFCVGRVDEITTDYRVENIGSSRVLEKLGFQSLGPASRYSLGANEETQTEQVRLACEDWLAMKACA